MIKGYEIRPSASSLEAPSQMETCPICRRQLNKDSQPKLRMYSCAVCGEYFLDWKAEADIRSLPADDRRLAGLSAYIRDANRVGEEPELAGSSWLRAADSYLHASVATKLRRVLDRAGQLTTRAGQPVPIYEALDYPLFFAQPSEVSYLLQALSDQELLKRTPDDGFIVTPKGWAQLEPSGVGGIAGTCFVAMSFKPELDTAYDKGIHPAVTEDCGFEVIQLSRVEHSENINDRIIAEIRRAQFLVADFTFHAAGVYFEAGFGLGLGKLVIWTCRRDEFKPDKVHFDTRPYNHILWDNENELRQKLANRVRALVNNAKRT